MIRGIIRGRTIELDTETGLAEGQEVTVTVCPVKPAKVESEIGEGLKQAFGGWEDDGEGLDEYLMWNRQQRKVSRSESGA